jgi:Uma2 family endonuclease
MAETAEPQHWTYEDYRRLPDDGKRYEIIRGEPVVCPSPSSRHQVVSMALSEFLGAFVRAGGLGRCLAAPIDLVLAPDVVLQPDLLFVSSERLDVVGAAAIAAAPDLVVEILSDSSRKRDCVEKRDLYATHGVREYWIVDPDVERVEQYALEAGDLVLRRVVTAGELSSLDVLPGFSMKLADLFA